MAQFKNFLLITIFLLFCNSSFVAVAQGTTPDGSTETTEIIQQTDENIAKDKKKKKDKIKEEPKDVVQINEAFFISFAINLATIMIIIMLIYYPNYKKQEMFFTYFLFNISIFMLTFLLNKIKISMGAAFGLFAVFSMLRYRTEGISMKDMTYLFIVIAVGLMSAIQLDYIDLGIINATIIISTFIFDGNFIIKREYSKLIYYDDIEMIKDGNQDKLLEDLKIRTGLNIHRISIVRIDFLRDIARIEAYYYLRKGKSEKTTNV
jgi:uncharacterized membrane protein